LGQVKALTAEGRLSGVILIASAGLVTRYEVGRSRGGAPTIGIFGIDSNIELEMRLFPTITLSGYLEGAITPWPYLAQSNLGDLSDADQVRVRLQLSIDVSRSVNAARSATAMRCRLSAPSCRCRRRSSRSRSPRARATVGPPVRPESVSTRCPR